MGYAFCSAGRFCSCTKCLLKETFVMLLLCSIIQKQQQYCHSLTISQKLSIVEAQVLVLQCMLDQSLESISKCQFSMNQSYTNKICIYVIGAFFVKSCEPHSCVLTQRLQQVQLIILPGDIGEPILDSVTRKQSTSVYRFIH